jgi:hypothetical protein
MPKVVCPASVRLLISGRDGTRGSRNKDFRSSFLSYFIALVWKSSYQAAVPTS